MLNRTEITVYTDGSKINNKVGSAFVVFKGNKIIHFQNYRLSDHATVFQAEIHAITQAGLYLLQTNKKIKYLRIFTDSQAAILAIHKVHITCLLYTSPSPRD